MTKDTVVAFRAPEGFSPDPLTDLLRQGVVSRSWWKFDGGVISG
jgi:hypothetical protein